MTPKILTILIGFAFLSSLVSCQEAHNSNSSVNTSSNLESTYLESTTSDFKNQNEIASYKLKANSKLDEIVNPIIDKIPNEELKEVVKNYYDAEKGYIEGIVDLEVAKTAVAMVIEDTKVFAMTTLKPLAISKLNEIIHPLISVISDDGLKNSVHAFYDTEMDKIDAAQDLESIINLYNEILNDTKDFIKTETSKLIVSLKNKALEELNPYVAALIEKIPYESLKVDTQEFYEEEQEKLMAVETIEGVSICIEEIKNDLEIYALEETKKIALTKLQEIIQEGLNKLPNEEIKANLQNFANEKIAKLNAIEKMEEIPSTLEKIIIETKDYIKNLLSSTIKAYLSRLIAIENTTAYDYLPSAMHPTYANNIVSESAIAYDFTSFNNVFDIHQAGYGEQWQMVVENINQSVIMAKVFNVAQTILNAAGNAVEIYLDNSYADEMSYIFNGEGYEGLFEFKNSKLTFNISLTNSLDIPVIGTVRPVIRMEYDLIKEAKGMFISLGDLYKVKYVVSNQTYEMATTYGITFAGKEASRASYLSITKINQKTIGHIYEYTTVEESDMIKACADFYVENGYVSVVGNKASGMIAFSGYVNELYLANEGRLLGYEVREELTVAGITGTYNTLWFNLWDIAGINTIKVTDKTDANKSGKSTVDVYLNGSSSLLSPTYNTKFGAKTSRKYDIEYRSRFYYTYDATNETYVKNEVKVPMMFIQEGDNFNSFEGDIKKDNNLVASVTLANKYLNKILEDYDTLIDIFIENKEAMSSEAILEYLSQYE